MNLTIHNTKRFMIQNISSPIHNLYRDSTTMFKSSNKIGTSAHTKLT